MLDDEGAAQFIGAAASALRGEMDAVDGSREKCETVVAEASADARCLEHDIECGDIRGQIHIVSLFRGEDFRLDGWLRERQCLVLFKEEVVDVLEGASIRSPEFGHDVEESIACLEGIQFHACPGGHSAGLQGLDLLP